MKKSKKSKNGGTHMMNGMPMKDKDMMMKPKMKEAERKKMMKKKK